MGNTGLNIPPRQGKRRHNYSKIFPLIGLAMIVACAAAGYGALYFLLS